MSVFVLPAIVYVLTKRICEELRDSDWHPLREPRVEISRTRSGGFESAGDRDRSRAASGPDRRSAG